MTAHDTTHTDYDLHGLVGIRLLGAGPHEVASVTRQLSPVIRRPLDREPDITIRFVDRLETASSVRLIGVDDAGFTDDAFLVLRSKHKSRVRVQIPFQDIGLRPCEIVAERGLPAVPLLIAIINLTMASKGVLPMHASGFEYGGTGALVTGWAKGGKTEVLLAFAAHGGRYVGDEWVYLTRDGQHMYGIPEPVRLWKWHFDEMPGYWSLVKRGDRVRLRGLDWVAHSMDRISNSRAVGRTAPGKLLRRLVPLVKAQLNVQIPPTRLFGDTAGAVTGTPQKLFFIASHERPDTRMEKVDPVQVAQRMVFSLQEERIELMSYYMKFRFAFPDVKNDLIDTLETREREMLVQALTGKEAYAVYHPYPVAIPSLYDVMKPVFVTK